MVPPLPGRPRWTGGLTSAMLRLGLAERAGGWSACSSGGASSREILFSSTWVSWRSLRPGSRSSGTCRHQHRVNTHNYSCSRRHQRRTASPHTTTAAAGDSSAAQRHHTQLQLQVDGGRWKISDAITEPSTVDSPHRYLICWKDRTYMSKDANFLPIQQHLDHLMLTIIQSDLKPGASPPNFEGGGEPRKVRRMREPVRRPGGRYSVQQLK